MLLRHYLQTDIEYSVQVRYLGQGLSIMMVEMVETLVQVLGELHELDQMMAHYLQQ